MATLTNAQAIENIKSFYSQYVPTYVAKDSAALDDAVKLFSLGLKEGMSLKASYDIVISQAVVVASGFENAYPSHPVPTGSQMTDALGFVKTFPASEVINYLYPNASAATKAGLITSIGNGSLSITDFASSISITKATTNPTVEQIKAMPETLTGAANLPDSGLHFAGVSDAQLHILTSMYIGAFGRTPDHELLKYWASELATDSAQGMSQQGAVLAVGQNIYKAGVENGENGTTLNNPDYVNFVYTNALGRAPDTDGFNYWVKDLAAGNINRGDFLTTFLSAGLDYERDANFLAARTAVGEFAAQKHVSGIGAPGIDTKAILNGVTDIASAQTAINSIIQKYGPAPAENQITLSGVSVHSDSALIL